MFLSARPFLPLGQEGTRTLCQAVGGGAHLPAPSRPGACARTLTTPHPSNQPRTRVRSIDHPPPPQSLGCAQRPTSLHSPSPQPVPRAQSPRHTQADPDPARGPPACAPGARQPAPPQPRARGPAPDPLVHRLGSSDPTREMPVEAASPLRAPQPSLIFFRKAPASLLPGKAEAPAARPSPSPAPAPGAPLRTRPPRPPPECRQRKAQGKALHRQPRQRCPPAPDLPPPPERAARLGREAAGSARIAGLGREWRRHAGQPRASPRRDAPRHPGPGARALPRSRRREAQRWRRPPKCRPLALPAQRRTGGDPGDGAPRARNSSRTPSGPRGAPPEPRPGNGERAPGPGPEGRPRTRAARYSLQ